MEVAGPVLAVRRRPPSPAVDLDFAAGPAIRDVIAGRLTPEAAIATGAVQILHGPDPLLTRFAHTFHLAA